MVAQCFSRSCGPRIRKHIVWLRVCILAHAHGDVPACLRELCFAYGEFMAFSEANDDVSGMAAVLSVRHRCSD